MFVKFRHDFGFIGHSKIGAMAHAEIEGFSVYRDGYTQKVPSQSRTYVTVWKQSHMQPCIRFFKCSNG